MESLLVFENGFGKTEFIERISIINDLRRLTIEYEEGLESIQEFSLNLVNNSQYIDSETKSGAIAGINDSRLTGMQFQIIALEIETYDLVEMMAAHMLQSEWEADDDSIYFDADEDADTYNQILNDMTVIFNQSSQLTLQANQIRQELIGNLNDL